MKPFLCVLFREAISLRISFSENVSMRAILAAKNCLFSGSGTQLGGIPNTPSYLLAFSGFIFFKVPLTTFTIPLGAALGFLVFGLRVLLLLFLAFFANGGDFFMVRI